MAAPHYVEILSGGPRPVWPEPPARLRTGSWKLWAKFNEDSSYASARTLLWIKRSGGGEGFSLVIVDDTGCKVRVSDHTGVLIEAAITFSALQRMKFTLDAVAGTLAIAGATSGNGTYSGTPWAVAEGGGEWRVGTADAGANPARGYVSLPYGLQTDDPLPDPTDDLGYLLTEGDDLLLEEGGGGLLIE